MSAILGGHGSRFELPFIEYITNTNHKWMVCIGVPTLPAYGNQLIPRNRMVASRLPCPRYEVRDPEEENGHVHGPTQPTTN